MQIKANLIDIRKRKITPSIVEYKGGFIASITETKQSCKSYILPGFIDAHIHIESSMLVPSEFARLAVLHGTVATVSDPHEIANVLGLEGAEFMLQNTNQTDFKFYFGAFPCVPATPFETSGDSLDIKAVTTLLQNQKIKFLSEVMNCPGVIAKDSDMILKIAAAKKANKPIDGHAPGLRGKGLTTYIEAGISTDHELITYEKIASDNEDDILKIAVINRYEDSKIKAIAHVEGFGLTSGAIASSVAHDSHNIIVVGTNDEDMAKAVNLIINSKGGISAVSKNHSHLLPLSIAGIMSGEDGFEIAKEYAKIDKFVKNILGSTLSAPFMTLSFMALLVIPEIKLSDKGLFDGRSFHFISPCKENK